MSVTKYRSELRQFIILSYATSRSDYETNCFHVNCEGGLAITPDMLKLERKGCLDRYRATIRGPKYYEGCTYGETGFGTTKGIEYPDNYILTDDLTRVSGFRITPKGYVLLEYLSKKFKMFLKNHYYQSNVHPPRNFKTFYYTHNLKWSNKWLEML